MHGVDVEGKQLGIDEELVQLLGASAPLPVTYAGGVRSLVRPLNTTIQQITTIGLEQSIESMSGTQERKLWIWGPSCSVLDCVESQPA